MSFSRIRCHSCESRNPGVYELFWIPAFARMTADHSYSCVLLTRINNADKGFPLVMEFNTESCMKERKSKRTIRFPHQKNPCFFRTQSSFTTITRMTTGDDIIPCGFPYLRTWHHMIKVEMRTRKFSSAILTRKIVS